MPSSNAARALPPEVPGAGQLRVLLAEDEAIGSRFAIAVLQRLGHEVVAVETGREALDLLLRERFDVALLDLGLPELSGLDVARRLRHHEQRSGNPAIIIVVLTAGELDAATREEVGIDAVLDKPVQLKVLSEALDACRSARALRPEEPEEPELDRAALFARACDDAELVREVVGDFLATSSPMLEELTQALASGDLGQAAGRAHRLRGALLALGANRAARAAGALEAVAGALAPAAQGLTPAQRAELTFAQRSFEARLDAAFEALRRLLGE
jgi:CheY-like chemotaxis protein